MTRLSSGDWPVAFVNHAARDVEAYGSMPQKAAVEKAGV